MTGKNSIKLSKICYKTENVPPLKSINLNLENATIHAIIGEHGSGKSLLSKIIAGHLRFTSGTVTYRGKRYGPAMTRELRKLPFQLLYQSFQLLDNFSVAHNLLIPDMMHYFSPFHKKHNFELACHYLDRYQINIDAKTLVRDLSISSRQLIYLIRALIRNPELIILDSSFELMTASDIAVAKRVLMESRNCGTTILYFTSRIDEVSGFADNLSILKKGSIIWSGPARDIDRISLIKMCYTEISKNNEEPTSDQEFYELFKFNEAIIHNLPIIILIVDPNNVVRMCNQSAKQFFKLPGDKITPFSLKDTIGGNNQQIWEQIEKILTPDETREIYNVKLQYSGENYTFNIKSFPISDSIHRIGHMLMIQDVSRQEELREQVILSEKLASVGLLAAGVAHEINNPLEIVFNIIGYLKYNTSSQEHLELLDDLEDEMSLIKQIVSNLITFSDNSRSASEYFDINELIDKLIGLIVFNAKKRDINISFNQRAEHAFITANRNEMRQVLLNLIRNSMEAMPDGGIVEVATIIEEKSPEHRYLKISVQDNGCGINDTSMNNIFLPFYSTKKRQGKNLGLGLSVSYGIIEKLQGSINVKNLPNGGCCFTIQIPMEEK